MQAQEQITKHVGREVRVDINEEERIVGVLSFFNWKSQVIHLNTYTHYIKDNIKEQGKFIIINTRGWKNLSVGVK